MLLGAGGARADSSETRCFDDLAKHAFDAYRARHRALGGCIRDKNTACRRFGTKKVTIADNLLERTLTAPQSNCRAAVDVDGLPASHFAPNVCPHGCDARVPAIATLSDVHRCYDCVLDALMDRFLDDFDLPGLRRTPVPDSKCIGRAAKGARGLVRSTLIEARKCVRGGRKPFSCPLSAGPGSRVGKAAEKLARQLGSCKDEAGERGKLPPLARNLCLGHISDLDDLARCMSENARCAACELVGSVLDDGRDCAAFSDLWRCRGPVSTIRSGEFYVTNGGDATLTFFTADGDPARGTLAASSLSVGASPAAVLARAPTQTVYVANAGSDDVTFLDGLDRDYIDGTLANSTFAVGRAPVALALVEEQAILYVVNSGDDSVTLLDAEDGRYARGTLAASTVAVGARPVAAVYNPDDDRLFVANAGDGTVTMLVGSTGGYAEGTLAASTVPAGIEPIALAYSTVTASGGGAGRIAVLDGGDDSVLHLDATSGAPAFGSAAHSTMAVPADPRAIVTTGQSFRLVSSATNALTGMVGKNGSIEFTVSAGAGPVAVARSGNELLVVEQGNDAVGLYSVGDSAGLSTLGVIGAALAVHPAADLLYGVEGREGGTLIFARASAPEYAHGTLEASSFTVVPPGETGGNFKQASIAVNKATDVLYAAAVIDTYRPWITYFDARTGAYVGDPTGRNDHVAAHDLAVDESANRLFASWRWSSFESASQSLAMLSGGSRAVLNTVRLSSEPFTSTTPPARSVDVEVNPVDGVAYATVSFNDTVVFLDSNSGDYLNGSLAASSVAVPGSPCGLAVDPAGARLYVTSQAENVVTFLDAVTGAYLNGTLESSSFAVGNAPCRAAVHAAAGLLYVSSDLGVTILDAANGAYLNGALEPSTFHLRDPTLIFGGSNGAVVVNETLDMLYVQSGFRSATYLDALTGRFAVQETDLALATYPTGPQPTAVAVMPN